MRKQLLIIDDNLGVIMDIVELITPEHNVEVRAYCKGSIKEDQVLAGIPFKVLPRDMEDLELTADILFLDGSLGESYAGGDIAEMVRKEYPSCKIFSISGGGINGIDDLKPNPKNGWEPEDKKKLQEVLTEILQ